jgi:hypothetical protein
MAIRPGPGPGDPQQRNRYGLIAEVFGLRTVLKF